VGAFGWFWPLRLLGAQLHSEVEIQRQTPDQPRRGGHTEESWLQTFRPALPALALRSKNPRTDDLLLATVDDRGQAPASLNSLHRILRTTLPPPDRDMQAIRPAGVATKSREKKQEQCS
jgi:hypothetical protein